MHDFKIAQKFRGFYEYVRLKEEYIQVPLHSRERLREEWRGRRDRDEERRTEEEKENAMGKQDNVKRDEDLLSTMRWGYARQQDKKGYRTERNGMRQVTKMKERMKEVFKCWSHALAWSTPVGPGCWSLEAGNFQCCLDCCSSAPYGWGSGADWGRYWKGIGCRWRYWWWCNDGCTRSVRSHSVTTARRGCWGTVASWSILCSLSHNPDSSSARHSY